MGFIAAGAAVYGLRLFMRFIAAGAAVYVGCACLWGLFAAGAAVYGYACLWGLLPLARRFMGCGPIFAADAAFEQKRKTRSPSWGPGF
jgi:hypothetical protein